VAAYHPQKFSARGSRFGKKLNSDDHFDRPFSFMAMKGKLRNPYTNTTGFGKQQLYADTRRGRSRRKLCEQLFLSRRRAFDQRNEQHRVHQLGSAVMHEHPPRVHCEAMTTSADESVYLK
jgi:hypothetical protein